MRFSVDYVVPPGAADGVLTLFVDGEPMAEFLDGVPERFAAFIGAWLQTLTEGHRLRILSLRVGLPSARADVGASSKLCATQTQILSPASACWHRTASMCNRPR